MQRVWRRPHPAAWPPSCRACMHAASPKVLAPLCPYHIQKWPWHSTLGHRAPTYVMLHQTVLWRSQSEGADPRVGAHAGLLVMVGSYEPSLELLLLCQDAASMQQDGGSGAWGFLRLHRLAEQALSTSCLPGEGACGNVEPGADIPHSLLLLPQPSCHAALQVCLSLALGKLEHPAAPAPHLCLCLTLWATCKL